MTQARTMSFVKEKHHHPATLPSPVRADAQSRLRFGDLKPAWRASSLIYHKHSLKQHLLHLLIQTQQDFLLFLPDFWNMQQTLALSSQVTESPCNVSLLNFVLQKQKERHSWQIWFLQWTSSGVSTAGRAWQCVSCYTCWRILSCGGFLLLEEKKS